MSSGGRWPEFDRLVAARQAAHAVETSASALFRALIDAADSALTDESLDELYQNGLTALRGVFGADSVAFLLANEAGDRLISRASTGLGEQRAVPLTISFGEGMAGRVLATREPLVIEDLTKVKLAWPTLREQGIRSLVAVPIIAGDQMLGVVHVGSRALAQFTLADAELLEFVADRFAVALERVRLFEQHRRLADMSAFLAETARITAEAPDFAEALERLAAAALPALGDICLIDVLEEGRLVRLVAKHRDPARQHLADRLLREFAPDASGPHPAARVMRSGQVSWAARMSDDFLRSTTHDDEHFALTKQLGFRSYLAVPIEADDTTIGTLTMVSCSRRFREEDLEFAQALSRQVGAMLHNAQRLGWAMRTSEILQEALLPSALPDVPGLVIDYRYEAASQSLDVGGDFYDLVVLDSGDVWFAIGDVEGHDRRAAGLMGQLRSAIRIMASRVTGPGELIEELHRSWELMEFERIATALVGKIDAGLERVSVACAGHYPPLLIRRDAADFVRLPSSPPLGVTVRRPENWTHAFQPDDILFFYTDGVVSDRTVGVERNMIYLKKAVLDGPTDLDSICNRVLATQATHEDDVALLAIQRASL